uniref:Molecular chaperone DnaK n=1 Tax=Thermosporothrix sp. COM3 TaxID=2490863 RepID=A0A455SI29_9CHLR|nr:molecular chaperone DnaK [Thermosporothrix sp. COM3]
MKGQETVFGIDLGTTYSCIAYVDEYGKAVVIPNREGDPTTPSVVQFAGSERIVGKEAKNSAVLAPGEVVEMVKRQMGDPHWRFIHEGIEYSPEEISSYILRKLTDDASEYLGQPVKDVVITCPAYFGIAQRDATAKAGELAGLNVREIINEPTAAAIMYGLQEEDNKTVLVYDLGGGTFDVTVIDIKDSAITVIATGGDHNLGGRNWDEAVVQYLAEQWKQQTGSSDDPLNSEETLQDLWGKAEDAKKTLTARQETTIAIVHAGQREKVVLSRETFNNLTADLLERTIDFTKSCMDEARSRGYGRIDEILLVGGSTRMPQVAQRLTAEFDIHQRIFDPDQAVAKGAALYGYKLLLGEKIKTAIADMTGTATEQVDVEAVDQTLVDQAVRQVAEEQGLVLGSAKKALDMKVTNVASHSFGIIAIDPATNREVISNIVLVNDPLPALKTRSYRTAEANQETVELQVIENTYSTAVVDDPSFGEEIGNAVLNLPYGLPPGARIDVTFELQRDGRLHMTGRHPDSNSVIEVDIQTSRGISEEEFQEAKSRAKNVVIS